MAVRGVNPLILLQGKVPDIGPAIDRFQKNKLEELKLARGAGSKFGLTPFVVADEEGNQRAFQLNSAGGMEELSIPSGMTATQFVELKSGASERGKLTEQLDLKPQITQQQELAKGRAKKIDASFDQIDLIDGNIRNLREATRLLQAGAGTGPLEELFPSVKASTVALNQMQKTLGLDVVGSVRFGALSKGELDLALDVALPTGLDEGPLRAWIDRKVAAQEKLKNYLEEQAFHLSEGGTRSSWRKLLKQEQKDRKTAGQGGTLGTLTPQGGTGTVPVAQDMSTVSDDDLFR